MNPIGFNRAPKSLEMTFSSSGGLGLPTLGHERHNSMDLLQIQIQIFQYFHVKVSYPSNKNLRLFLNFKRLEQGCFLREEF
jgi:hypothetical protein